ncbi:RrF2 family transcriptional regulator [Rhodohalobacter sp. 8-1]|uniref:RrF2 family transcriptional regulator n=1 Tax=Rhodohalobacter sp. 8-1 TaxID=3131972 RepID=UPI0030ECDEA2
MLLSKSCKYGLRASVLLAALEHESYVSIRDLSNELNISFHFLTKIFQKLNAADLLDSKKGVNGGVKLSIPPDQILFMDIVVAIDGTGLMDTCALGLPGCGKKRPCPMHEQWSTIKASLLSTMETTTLEDIISEKCDHLSMTISDGKIGSEYPTHIKT